MMTEWDYSLHRVGVNSSALVIRHQSKERVRYCTIGEESLDARRAEERTDRQGATIAHFNPQVGTGYDGTAAYQVQRTVKAHRSNWRFMETEEARRH